MELLKAVLFGIVEGVTEWLPISSTGHLILLNEFITLNVSDAFRSMFDVVIQLGAILAVIVLFFHKLNPFSPTKSEGEKKQTWQLWFKVIAAIIPSGIVGVLFDDWMEAHFHNATVVSIALIVYGVAFILVERRNARRVGGKTVEDVYAIDYKTALLIGCFQCLSLIPGTSRSVSGAVFGSRHFPLRLHHSGRDSHRRGTQRRRGVLLLHGHSHHAGGVRHQGAEISAQRRRRHRHRDRRADRGVRGVVPGEPACHPGTDGICAQALLLRLRRLPHHPGRGGAGLLRAGGIRDMFRVL